MIKKFKEFNESSRPKEGDSKSKSLKLTPEEVQLFSEPILYRLIEKEKVSLFDDVVWYLKDDKETVDILDQYFEI